MEGFPVIVIIMTPINLFRSSLKNRDNVFVHALCKFMKIPVNVTDGPEISILMGLIQATYSNSKL